MKLKVTFYSYFKDLTGTAEIRQDIREGSTIADLWVVLVQRFPTLEKVEHSTLVAVGVEYQQRNYVLQDGDEVSLFPPVQGG